MIHGVDSLIFPPPKVLTIVDLLPGEFSTLELGLTKTGLYDYLKDIPHKGSTFFAPTNFAFKKLGPKINAFLFSKYGQKYLAALLKYHVVLNETLYSNAFYDSEHSEINDKGRGLYHVSNALFSISSCDLLLFYHLLTLERLIYQLFLKIDS